MRSRESCDIIATGYYKFNAIFLAAYAATEKYGKLYQNKSKGGAVMITLKLISSLEKVYTYDSAEFSELGDFSMLKGERKSFQILAVSNSDFNGAISVNSDIDSITVYSVGYVPCATPLRLVNKNDDYNRISEDGLYPDVLRPVDTNNISFKAGKNVFWVEASSAKAGNFNISVSIGDATASVNIEVIDATLDFGSFIYTNWFHSDCLMSHYNFEAFSEEYWRVVANYVKMAAEHGMNCILTPVFTPPLDTKIGGERPTVQLVDITLDGGVYTFRFDKLTEWINLCQSLGIEYFEISHFFTQWGAKAAPKIMATADGEYKRIFGWDTPSDSVEYVEFLTQFSCAFKAYISEKGLKDKVFLHISDEPSIKDIESYSKASKLVRRLFDGYTVIDALSEPEFYEMGLVTNPVPSCCDLHKFFGKVEKLWTYYCCVQTFDCISNRMFCFPSLRNRILGYQMFKFDIKGFLHWGYNFYYLQHSVGKINPYEVTDAGGNFPGGDSFIVYPADDGSSYPSLRLKVFYDGLQDMAALNTLAGLIGKEKALAVIDAVSSLSFTDYPHENEWLLSTREAVNKEIKKHLKF